MVIRLGMLDRSTPILMGAKAREAVQKFALGTKVHLTLDPDTDTAWLESSDEAIEEEILHTWITSHRCSVHVGAAVERELAHVMKGRGGRKRA